MLGKRIRRYVDEAVRNGSLSSYQADIVLGDSRTKTLVRMHRQAGFDMDTSLMRGTRMMLDCYALGMFPEKEAF